MLTLVHNRKQPTAREKIEEILSLSGAVDGSAPQYLWDMLVDELEELILETEYRRWPTNS